MFGFVLWFKMTFIAMSVVSGCRILAKGPITMWETRKLPERFAILIWETKCNSNLQVLRVKKEHKGKGQDHS